MDASLKRIIAYIIDIALVSIIVSILGNLSFINPDADSYSKTSTEYNEFISNYNNEEISDEEYTKEMINYNYDLGKYSIIYSGITIVGLIIYFAGVQYFLKGQTFGKKIMKLRVVHVDDKKKLGISNYLIRTVIINNIVFRLALLIGILFMGKNIYFHYYSVIGVLELLVECVILVMVIMRSDHRGLHDLLSKTKVIKVD